jgi:uncharacterized protein (TIRG00374 family)
VKLIKLLPYVVIIGAVVFTVSRLIPHFKDFSELWELKNQMNYYWIMAAVGSQVVQYFGDGWLSQVLLKVVGISIKMKDTFRIAALNVFAAHMLPIGEAGALAACYHFYRKLGVNAEKFIFVTICWSIITHIALFLLLFIPIFFLADRPKLPIEIDRKFTYILVSCLAVLVTIFLNRKIIFLKLEKIFGKYKWFMHFSLFIRNRHNYKKLVLSHPGTIIIALSASLIYYASNIATLAFSFLVFGILPPLPLLIFAYSASLLLGRIALAPAGLGVAEATLIFIFQEASINPLIALGATLVYRLISFWLPIPAGLFSFYSLKKDLTKKEFLEPV